MNSRSKGFSLLLISVLVISSLTLLMVKPVSAQTTAMPTVPVFSLALVNHSYSVPSTTSSTTNPYTNKTTITTVPSNYVQNITIDMTIKNQPFPSTVNGYKANIYYVVQTKPHFGNDWESLEQNDFPSINDTSGNIPVVYNFYLPIQSNASKTVIQFPADYTVGDELDF